MLLRRIVIMVGLGLVVAWPAFSQESTSSTIRTVALAQNDPAETPAKKTQRRLPNHFSKLDLSDQQRDKIYDAQAKYNSKIDELEAQIEQLKTARKQEVESVLTSSQKQKLQTLLEDAKEKSAKKAKEKNTSKPKKVEE